jgi:hypothetical protein
VANSFVDNPPNALICSAIIAVGVPVYFAWRWWRGRHGPPPDQPSVPRDLPQAVARGR